MVGFLVEICKVFAILIKIPKNTILKLSNIEIEIINLFVTKTHLIIIFIKIENL